MATHQHAGTPEVSATSDYWQLKRRGKPLAIIERAWDDYHWLLFLADADGELVCQNAYRRVATLKACLRLWVQRNS